MFDLNGIKIVQSEAIEKGKLIIMSGKPDYDKEDPPNPEKAFREWAEKYVYMIKNIGDERREGQR